MFVKERLVSGEAGGINALTGVMLVALLVNLPSTKLKLLQQLPATFN